MKINLDNASDEARIELLPLIDVIFCILTFFLLAALGLTRQQAITVDLPQASNATTPQIASRLLVSINPYNQIYVENQLVTPEQLEQKLGEFNQKNPQGIMVLYASKTAFYNDVVQVLDKMQAVGGDRVALATLPESETPGTSPLPTPSTSVPSVITPGTLPTATPDAGVPGSLPIPTPGAQVPGTLPAPGTGTPGTLPLPTPGAQVPGTFPTPGAQVPGTLPPTTATPGVTPESPRSR
ncbi:biopolymer transporter ExbD [Phormidium sp. LEGE 05292]|uniref:ExbD/TolR family protein n=1 Tax=[Phormidium] sp. LEGE 05292 TaxID=767427 RepID=UPI00188284D2|nr:biopolymer transporter ExbD [Phormidium sp. LEGE 05292]MBE9225137.1 biopolymer transporter ExbD [Phormidium sp. LEGE 05292]